MGTATNRICRSLRVAGGTTFVSKYVAYYFVNHGYEVYVLNRNSKPQVKGVTLITGDRHHLGDILKGMHFDIVADITAYDAQDIIDLYHALGSFEFYEYFMFLSVHISEKIFGYLKAKVQYMMC